MPSIRILVADDQTLIRRLLVRRLSAEPDLDVVGEAENGRQAVDLAQKLRPDVIVMDLNMPLMNGAQATERIVAQQPFIKVVILTALDELASIGRFSGAFECLDKGCTPEELVATIRQAKESRGAVTEPTTGRDRRNTIERLSIRGGLTERERSVMEKVISTELTIQQIARALSEGAEDEVTASAVKHALERAMTKLRIDPRTRAALVKFVLEFEQAS